MKSPHLNKKKIEFCNEELLEAFRMMLDVLGVETELTDPKELRNLVIEKLSELQNLICNPEKGKMFESEALEAMKQNIDSNNGDGVCLKDCLLEVKKTYEAGGDLDTLGSNALYGIWAINVIEKEKGSPAIYGIDYDFDFVNYHDGLRHLDKHKSCDIYLPDFPIEAIPDLEGDLRYLAESNTYVRRFDDHHPYTREKGDLLEKLLQEKIIDHYAMSGPILEEEEEEVAKDA